MQSHILPTEDLAAIYRFAVLLSGAPEFAQDAVLETFADAGEKIHHFRSGKSCKAWLVTKVRTWLLKKSGAPTNEETLEKTGEVPNTLTELTPEALELANRFYKIPEPGRSALALLYLDSFSPQEIAQILQMSMEELGNALDAARTLLRQMEAVEQTPTAPEAQQP